MVDRDDLYYVFQVEEWDRDGMELANESDYRQLLALITNKPDVDLIISREVILNSPLLNEMNKLYNNAIFTYPSQGNINFLSDLGNNPTTKTTFHWKEDNKAE